MAAAACAADRVPAAPSTYHNQLHGYTLEHSRELELREYTPEYVAIGEAADEGFDALVEVAVDEGDAVSFEAAAIERARQACAADGPDVSLQCLGVQAVQPFVSDSGAEGLVFYLRHVTTRAGTDEVVAESGRGPFFAFELPRPAADGTFRLLYVRAPVVLAPHQADAELVRSVAASLRLSGGPAAAP